MQFVAAAADDDEEEEEGIRQERAEARGHKQVVNSLKGEYLPVRLSACSSVNRHRPTGTAYGDPGIQLRCPARAECRRGAEGEEGEEGLLTVDFH